jgi:hypothetical protein
VLRRLGYLDTGRPPHMRATDEFRSALELYRQIGDRVG